MQESSKGDTPRINLNCFNNQPPPPIVIEGWKQLSAFSPSALEAFWLLLGPVLLHPGIPSNQELINLFCEEHDVSSESMLIAIGCCEALLKQAAALDLPQEAFEQDLKALSDGDADELSRFILGRYPDAKQGLRQQILKETLAAHGKVMTGLEWRLDRVLHSSKGNRLDTDIVVLTLNYDEGNRQSSISLQLTKDAARQLRNFSERLADQGTE